MSRKKTRKLSTIRSNISHLRKMISRLDQMKTLKPPKGLEVRVVQSGSTFKINGKSYTPAQLESLAGQYHDWKLPAIAELERKLREEEYAALRHPDVVKNKRKITKITHLTPLEVEQAEAGLDYITTAEEEKFTQWIDAGSDGIKKNHYYHIYGADTVNPGDIMNFLEFMAWKTGKEIKEVEDLYGLFRDKN